MLGAPATQSDSFGLGAAYVFLRGDAGWSEVAELTDSDPDPYDLFGSSVAFSGDTAVVGVPSDDHAGGLNAGSAFVFRFGPESMSYCTAGTSASGCQALLSVSGTASASAASGFLLQAADIEGAKDGGVFWGKSGKLALPWGNGTSFQCVAPPVTRGGPLPGLRTAHVGVCCELAEKALNGVSSSGAECN